MKDNCRHQHVFHSNAMEIGKYADVEIIFVKVFAIITSINAFQSHTIFINDSRRQSIEKRNDAILKCALHNKIGGNGGNAFPD